MLIVNLRLTEPARGGGLFWTAGVTGAKANQSESETVHSPTDDSLPSGGVWYITRMVW